MLQYTIYDICTIARQPCGHCHIYTLHSANGHTFKTLMSGGAWKPGVIMMPTLLSPVPHNRRLSLCDDKVGIMLFFEFQGKSAYELGRFWSRWWPIKYHLRPIAINQISVDSSSIRSHQDWRGLRWYLVFNAVKMVNAAMEIQVLDTQRIGKARKNTTPFQTTTKIIIKLNLTISWKKVVTQFIDAHMPH